MKEWFLTFWDDNGQRLVYMAIALAVSLLMIWIFDMAAEGKTILVGVATFALTRMRGGSANSQGEK